MNIQWKEIVVLLSVAWTIIYGAKYDGASSAAAGALIDRAQGQIPNGITKPGHARGHAVKLPKPPNPIDSVQGYSMGTIKTGFRSRDAQNKIVHLALKSQTAQDAMKSLNDPSTTECCKRIFVSSWEVDTYFELVEIWKNGWKKRNALMVTVVMVLCDFKGRAKDASSDVFIHTAYPIGVPVPG